MMYPTGWSCKLTRGNLYLLVASQLLEESIIEAGEVLCGSVVEKQGD